MKRMILAFVAVLCLGSLGCTHHNLARNNCGACRGNHGGHAGRHDGGIGGGGAGGGGVLAGIHQQGTSLDQGPSGPPSASVAYPYYTVRGPRDFLMNNPPSIGR